MFFVFQLRSNCELVLGGYFLWVSSHCLLAVIKNSQHQNKGEFIFCERYFQQNLKKMMNEWFGVVNGGLLMVNGYIFICGFYLKLN